MIAAPEADAPAAIVISRIYPEPVPGWVRAIGPVSITGEREMFGRVFQKEVTILATGKRAAIDSREVFEGENIAAFIPRPRGQQIALDIPCDSEGPAA